VGGARGDSKESDLGLPVCPRPTSTVSVRVTHGSPPVSPLLTHCRWAHTALQATDVTFVVPPDLLGPAKGSGTRVGTGHDTPPHAHAVDSPTLNHHC
jgi:hypothetical protein